jgi:hypothetical protein
VRVCICRTSHFRQRHRFNEVCSPQTAASFGRLRVSKQDEAAQAQAASELPEFLDLGPKEFGLYFNAYEKRAPSCLA